PANAPASIWRFQTSGRTSWRKVRCGLPRKRRNPRPTRTSPSNFRPTNWRRCRAHPAALTALRQARSPEQSLPADGPGFRFCWHLVGLLRHLQAGQQFNVARRAIETSEARALVLLRNAVLGPVLPELFERGVFVILAS